MSFLKMQHLLKVIFVLLQLIIIPYAAAENSQPYCYKNITETSYKIVTKTRIKAVSSKNIFKKIIFKKDTQVEVYEDQEPVYTIRVERICCEGYQMDQYNLCQPQCVENGCPQHSKCVEPEVCECKKGYFSVRSAVDGKHYCEPICEEPCPEYSECVGPNQCACKMGYYHNEGICKPYCASGCPHGGVCIMPNKCSCEKGYTAKMGSCISITAICTLGDQCQHGTCVGNDLCICNSGFIWNSKTHTCEYNSMESSTYSTDVTEFPQSTKFFIEVETDIETSNEEIDPNEVFDENIETTTVITTDEYGSSTHTPHCPNDYVLHKGLCRPLKFVSNEINCCLKPCLDKNAECLENGTCACKEGFKSFSSHAVNENSLNQTIKSDCLTAAEYQARLQNDIEDPRKDDIQQPTNWTLIFFIVLGVLIIAAALVYLSLKIFLKQTGEIDVEGKNLSCTYDNRPATETEKSVI